MSGGIRTWLEEVGVAEAASFSVLSYLSTLLGASALLAFTEGFGRLFPSEGTPRDVGAAPVAADLLAALLLAGAAGWLAAANWRRWRNALLARDLRCDELAPLRAPKASEAMMLEDEALAGLTRRAARLCRRYPVADPDLRLFLTDYRRVIDFYEREDIRLTTAVEQLTRVAEDGLARGRRVS